MFGLFVVTVFMPLLILFALEAFQLKLQARNKLLQTSDEISRRMEERLHQLNSHFLCRGTNVDVCKRWLNGGHFGSQMSKPTPHSPQDF